MKKWLSLIIFAFSILTSSCVNQFPIEEETDTVYLTVVRDAEWLPDAVINLTKAGIIDIELRYDFRIYPKGNTKNCLKEFTIYKSDLTGESFQTSFEMHTGDYDIYCWSDFAYSLNGLPVYYDDSNFSAITYIKPYEGDSDFRDAFRGVTSFSIKDSGYYQMQPVEATIILSRPLARYMFIATDLEDFIEKEATRERNRNSDSLNDQDAYTRVTNLDDYIVKVTYPLYMPAVFDNFLNNPIDSWTGISFEGTMTKISDQEARLALDYVMVNGEESGVQVMLEVFDPDGVVIARTNSMTIPTKRNRTTIVYGKYLTTLRNDGVGIDPDFNGSFNIELP